MERQIINSRAFFLILAACMLLAVQSVTYGATTVSMSPSTVVAPSVGQQLTFTINITDGVNVYSTQLDVTFDPTVLSYVSAEAGGYHANPVSQITRAGNNTIRIGEGSLPWAPASGSGRLATITFRVVAVQNSTIGLSAILSHRLPVPQSGIIVSGARITTTATETEGTTGNTGPPPPEPDPTVFFRISGDNQRGVVGEPLAKPFVVKTQDRGADPLEDMRVVFRVVTGGGTLSPETVFTDATGRAESTLTLGSEPGTNTVEVSAHGTSRVLTFRAEATLPPTPTALSVISGDNQSGLTGETLVDPFVVEVRDANANPLENVTVNFAVLTGAGTLSATTGMTDATGRAETTLTLGTDPGTNTVEVSVDGVSQTVVFSAEATLPPPIPTALSTVSDGERDGLTGEPSMDPYVVEVHDQNGDPIEGVTVTFTIVGPDGSKTVTTVMTDENGGAAFMLPAGSDPGRYTITASVEGIADTVTFIIVVPFEFDLVLPAGLSLIHIPLKVRAIEGMTGTIESVSDLYDAFGGADTVNWFITYDPAPQNWHSYSGPADSSTITDSVLTDQTGILASAKKPVSVRLGGDALGIDGTSTIPLNPGLNLVGLPLQDSRIMRVSDLFTLEGIGDNITAIVVTDNGEFKVVGRAGDPGDIPITGGQSFVLITQSAAMVPISGDGWDNVP